MERPSRDHKTEKGTRAKLDTALGEGQAREVAFAPALYSQGSVKGQQGGLEPTAWKNPPL